MQHVRWGPCCIQRDPIATFCSSEELFGVVGWDLSTYTKVGVIFFWAGEVRGFAWLKSFCVPSGKTFSIGTGKLVDTPPFFLSLARLCLGQRKSDEALRCFAGWADDKPSLPFGGNTHTSILANGWLRCCRRSLCNWQFLRESTITISAVTCSFTFPTLRVTLSEPV